MNSTKDELREKIHKLGQRYGYFWVKAFDIDYELNEDRVFREAFIDQLLDMFAERERLARKETEQEILLKLSDRIVSALQPSNKETIQ